MNNNIVNMPSFTRTPITGLNISSNSSDLLAANNLNPKKKRRSNSNLISHSQQVPLVQDLLPPPLTGYGDTIVATNPFDDMPQSSLNSVSTASTLLSSLHSHNINSTMRSINSSASLSGLSTMISHNINNMSSVITNIHNQSNHISNISNMNNPQLGNIHSNNNVRSSISQNLLSNHIGINSTLSNQTGSVLDNSINFACNSSGSPLRSINQILERSVNASVGTAIASTNQTTEIGNQIISNNCVSSVIDNVNNSTTSQANSQTLPNHITNNNSSILSSSVNIQLPVINGTTQNGIQCMSQIVSHDLESSQTNITTNLDVNPHIRTDQASNITNKSSSNQMININSPSYQNFHGSTNCSAIGSKTTAVIPGKIYPPDQPMVFNPQNPNAPPIYPCGVCHKEVHDNDQAILCESGCNFWFHRGCTGLSETAYQLLTQEVYAEWVCDKCLQSKNIPLIKFKP